ncbi:MAG: T9SS type A sorting domain-containing protein [Ignavibacteriaceae bacterium]
MNKIYTSFVLAFFFTISLLAQLSPPKVEDVYGGRINRITGYSKTSDTSRIFISTESANSIFYTDVYTPATGSAVFSPFHKMNGADADDNFGGNIRSMGIHELSGTLYFGENNGVYKVHPDDLTATKLFNTPRPEVFVEGSTLVAYASGSIYWGSLDAAGNFTANASSPNMLALPMIPFSLKYNEVNSYIYLFSMGSSPQLYKSSVTLSSLGSATTFSAISLAPLGSGTNWSAFGVSPSGRLFIGGTSGPNKIVAYSDDETTWTLVNTGLGGAGSDDFAFGGTTANYFVYFASGYNSNNGLAGNWFGFGTPGGSETSANDGAVFCDPNDFEIVYMTTDQGIGASVDRGLTIFEINDGVEAVQVEDFDMTADKQTAWLASKSGIRMVTDYLTTPVWTDAIFPNGDGSPYHSSEMVPGNPNTVYAGNIRVYKSVTAGATWNMVFTAENPPYNFNNTQTLVEAIEVCDFDTNIIMAGYYTHESDKGGLFCSGDNGATWSQILLHASSIGQDVDVYDIVFNLEGADTVAYVGVEYDLTAPTGRSVYKLTKNGSTWTVAQDMNGATTSTGTVIVATIRDLFVSLSADTIYACGTDAGINHPIVYYKPLNTTGKWTPFTTTGFPFVAGKQGYALTKGVDTLYAAVDNEIYFYDFSAGTWQLGSTYPVGMKIYFLYFDDLLVGTSTGLYSQVGVTNPSVVKDGEGIAETFALSQNYPNPFNPTTVISYRLQVPGHVTLKLFDVLGNELAVLVDALQEAGNYDYKLSTINTKLSSGTYFYQLRAGDFLSTKKMILLK